VYMWLTIYRKCSLYFWQIVVTQSKRGLEFSDSWSG